MFAFATFAQQPAAGGKKPMPMQAGMAKADCEAMMQKMQGSSKPMDDRLQMLVDDMNRATGSAKVDRMAAVMNELVTQYKAMREHMTTMMPKMTEHMAKHKETGGMQAMAGCPMMNGAEKAPDATPRAHKH